MKTIPFDPAFSISDTPVDFVSGVATAAKTNVARSSAVGFPSTTGPVSEFETLLSFLHYALLLSSPLRVALGWVQEERENQDSVPPGSGGTVHIQYALASLSG